MGKRRIKAIFLLLVLLLSLPFAGCSRKTEKERIFNKTIHDFPGYRVDNLDDQEDTNFVVYAKGTQEIQSNSQVNTLLEVNEEERYYTFANPDQQLLTLKEGDVFWAVASADSASSIAAKVKGMERTGDTVTVYSDTLDLGDLFEYADVDMSVPVTELGYDPADLPEGTEILAGVEGTEKNTRRNGATVNVGYTVRHRLDISRGGNTRVTGMLSSTIHNVWIEFRFSREEGKLYTGVSVDSGYDHQLGVHVTGKAVDKKIPLSKLRIPVGAFLIGVGVEPTLNFQVTGIWNGSLHFSERTRKGFTLDVSKRGIEPAAINETLQPFAITTPSLTDASGKVSVGVELRPVLDIGFVGKAYGSVFVGAEATGSYDPMEEYESVQSGDAVHDCAVCIDGKVEAVRKLSVGASIELSADNVLAKIDATLEEVRQRLKAFDFYISFGNEGGKLAEFGWGDCPYQRWKTTVKVTKEDGSAAVGATVNATYPDGRTDSGTTEESGTAILYLPNGDNLLSCGYQGQRGSGHATVNGKPTTATIKLDETQDVFILYRFHDGNGGSLPNFDSSELSQILQAQYPDAIYIHIDEWASNTQSSPNPNIVIANYSAQGLAETYGASPGDVVICVQELPWGGNSSGYNHLAVFAGVFLLPDLEQDKDPTEATEAIEETTPPEDIPSVIWLYQGGFSARAEIASDTNHNSYIKRAYYYCDEMVWQGLRFDSGYRIEEIGTHWENSVWEDPAPGTGMAEGSFYADFTMHHGNLANYLLRVFPYTEMVLNHQWDVNTDSSTQP